MITRLVPFAASGLALLAVIAAGVRSQRPGLTPGTRKLLADRESPDVARADAIVRAANEVR